MPTHTGGDFCCHIAIDFRCHHQLIDTDYYIVITIELIHTRGVLESQFNATDFTVIIAMLEVLFSAIINSLPQSSISNSISISILAQEEVQREAIAATDE